MLVEPSGAARPHRRTPRSALRPPRFDRVGPRQACAIAAAVLVVTGRGDLWVLAVLLGLADQSVGPTLVAGAAGAAALERFGSAGLADIAGAQSVLGAAGWHGTTPAVVASWAFAIALVFVCRRPGPAAIAGALGALLLAGPALAGGLGDAMLHVVALAAGAGLGWLAAPRRAAGHRQVAIAYVMAVGGLACLFLSSV